MRLLLFLLHFVCLRDLWDKLIQFKDSVIKVNFRCNPGDTDVFKAFSGRLKKVTTSYDQTRRRHDVWKMTSNLRRLEDVQFTTFWRRLIYAVFRKSGFQRPKRRLICVVLKTSNLRRLENVWFTTSSGRLIYDVLKTSDLRRLEDVQFTTSWRRLIYDVLRTSDLRRLEDVCFTSSWRRPIYDVLKTSDLRRLQDVWFSTSWRRLIYDVLKTS